MTTIEDLFDVEYLLDLEEGLNQMIDVLFEMGEFKEAYDEERVIDYLYDYLTQAMDFSLISKDEKETEEEEEETEMDTLKDTETEGDDTLTELDEDEIIEFIKEHIRTYIDFMTISSLIPSIPSIPYCLKMEDYHEKTTEESQLRLKNQIDELRKRPQPEQRTQEWFDLRNTLITASNIYKIFGTKSQYNSLICEKCVSTPSVSRNVCGRSNDPRGWGQKYEKLSLQIYKEMFETEVEEFGCIRHPDYSFIGASPDGIVVGKNHYGRMIEIKNIVNRDITGKPLDSYWIQMQVQMEVCDLDLCNFIETRFKECQTNEEWLSIEKKKGIVFKEEKNGIETFEFVIFEGERDENKESLFLKKWCLMPDFQRWYMDEFSCILVPRNREWFQSVLPKIKETWDVILKEKEDKEYVHRLPKKKVSKCVVEFEKEEFEKGDFKEDVKIIKI